MSPAIVTPTFVVPLLEDAWTTGVADPYAVVVPYSKWKLVGRSVGVIVPGSAALSSVTGAASAAVRLLGLDPLGVTRLLARLAADNEVTTIVSPGDITDVVVGDDTAQMRLCDVVIELRPHDTIGVEAEWAHALASLRELRLPS